MKLLITLILTCALLSYPASAQVGQHYYVGKTYTMGVSLCLERKDLDAIVEAEKQGLGDQMFSALNSLGKCANMPVELTFTKVIGHFTRKDGVEIYLAEATVKSVEGKELTVYVAITKPVEEVEA